MARRVPESTLDEAARLIVEGMSIPKAAEQAGLGNATLYTKVGDTEAIRLWATQRMTPERREQSSLRERVATAIATKGPFESVGDLRDAIAEPRELIVFQAIVGAVWSLQKQGEVAVTQTSHTHMTNGHGAPDGGLKNIRALPGLYRRLKLPEPTKSVALSGRSAALIGPIAQAAESNPRAAENPMQAPAEPEPLRQNERPEPPAYPLLVAIRARATQARRAREAAKMIEAAAELVSADEKDRLLNEAVALIDAHDLSPIEEEYLTYAEAHA